MDIDLSVLRSLESEKDISLDLAIKAIEDALLVAYHKSDGASANARVEVDRKSGHVTVWATQADRTGRRHGSTTTPRQGSAGSRPPLPGRSSSSVFATATTRCLGEFKGREGDIVAGVIQQGKTHG